MRTFPSWKIPFLGLRQFPRSLTLFEIATFFNFNNEERNAIQSRRGDHLRLAFGIHLNFLKMTGTALSAVDRIPMFVLMQVSDELDLPRVDIATVRSLFRRRKRTLYEHQQWAMQLLGIDAFNERHQRALMRAFRPPVSNASDVRAMAIEIMSWLFTRGIDPIVHPDTESCLSERHVKRRGSFRWRGADRVALRPAQRIGVGTRESEFSATRCHDDR